MWPAFYRRPAQAVGAVRGREEARYQVLDRDAAVAAFEERPGGTDHPRRQAQRDNHPFAALNVADRSGDRPMSSPGTGTASSQSSRASLTVRSPRATPDRHDPRQLTTRHPRQRRGLGWTRDPWFHLHLHPTSSSWLNMGRNALAPRADRHKPSAAMSSSRCPT